MIDSEFHPGLTCADKALTPTPAAINPQPAWILPAAWLHYVAQDDGEQDQALSFSRHSFPLEGVGGFRSVQVRPLFLAALTPAEIMLAYENMIEDRATLARQLAEAEREATQLAQWLWRHHWSDVAPKWEPCDSLPGVLSQIDNMIAAMCRTDRAEQAESQLAEATRRLGEVEEVSELRKVAKRNLRSLIERSSDSEKELMLKCLGELS